MKYTQGKWFYEADVFNNPANRGDCIGSVRCEDSDTTPWFIAAVCGDIDEAEANARLIAAAPDMYETLQRVYENATTCEYSRELIRAALSKAEGETK